MSAYPFTCGNAKHGPCGSCLDCEREGVVSVVAPAVLEQLLAAARPKEDWHARELRLHREAEARGQ